MFVSLHTNLVITMSFDRCIQATYHFGWICSMSNSDTFNAYTWEWERSIATTQVITSTLFKRCQVFNNPRKRRKHTSLSTIIKKLLWVGKQSSCQECGFQQRPTFCILTFVKVLVQPKGLLSINPKRLEWWFRNYTSLSKHRVIGPCSLSEHRVIGSSECWQGKWHGFILLH